MLSFILPSPVTFTVKALPVYTHEQIHFYKTKTCASSVIRLFHVSTWHMLVSKLDVDDVISWFSGAVGDLAGAILLVLSVNVHFAGAFNGEAQATVA